MGVYKMMVINNNTSQLKKENVNLIVDNFARELLSGKKETTTGSESEQFIIGSESPIHGTSAMNKIPLIKQYQYWAKTQNISDATISSSSNNLWAVFRFCSNLYHGQPQPVDGLHTVDEFGNKMDKNNCPHQCESAQEHYTIHT